MIVVAFAVRFTIAMLAGAVALLVVGVVHALTLAERFGAWRRG